VLDLTDNAQLRQIRREFDGIIADVPCSGSGTWSRTPEMLSIFRESTLKEYRDRQIHIIQNISGFLKKEKNLVYITCSVFKKENEDMIEAITQKTGLKLLESQLIQGYDRQADTMFVSLLAK
jgi:16S rRNA (cytosine967-C5)-methyltransferase